MDVTFNENQSFFTSHHYFQGETPNEDRGFDEDSGFEPLPLLPSAPLNPTLSNPTSSPSLSSPSPLSPPSPLSSPLSPLTGPSSPSSPLLSSSSFPSSPSKNEPTKLQVYSRRTKLNLELNQVPLSEPLTSNEITHPYPSSNELESSDLDLPIALRKATRKCTQHPISKFVSYHRLSTQHKAFITALDSITIPNSVHEAFEDRN